MKIGRIKCKNGALVAIDLYVLKHSKRVPPNNGSF